MAPREALLPEMQAIVALCRSVEHPIEIPELARRSRLPLVYVDVLVGLLLRHGLLQRPVPPARPLTDTPTLRRVRDALHHL